MSHKRHFLFLQGFTSYFLTALAAKLRQEGHRVTKVNFNTGDDTYWGVQPARHFREPPERLSEYLNELFCQEHYTDVVVMGDTRPIHTPIRPIAEKHGANLHVFEEGYFRPSWVTLEKNGVNGFSQLPHDPDWYRAAGQQIPEQPVVQPVTNPLWLLAVHEVTYHLANILNPFLYKGYRTHRSAISGVEFAGWGRRFARMPLWKQRDKRTIRQLIAAKTDYFILPLQLDCDSQIKYHSPFDSMTQVLELVISSFAAAAPSHTKLVIKNHPLDTGLVDYRQIVKQLEQLKDLEGRLVYLESGDLPTLLKHTKGVVTVNSTVGTSSLIFSCPTIALGTAIYDMPGLTFQGSLDQFWRCAEQPDAQLFSAFRNTVIHTTQVNGGFYSVNGVKLAVQNSHKIITARKSGRSLLEKLFDKIGAP